MPIINYPRFQVIDDDGSLLDGGRLYFYEDQTDTTKPVYTDPEFKEPWTQPVVLNSIGKATVFGQGKYKVVINRSDGTLVETINGLHLYNISTFVESLFDSPNAADFRYRIGITNIVAQSHKHSYQLATPDNYPVELPNNTRTGFSTATYFITGTLQVYVNGVLYRNGTDYTEDADKKGYNLAWAPREGEIVAHEYLVDE